nr:hypothetical protein [Tanacetum cinerariifolium]
MRVKMLELLRKMISVINGENNEDSKKVSCGNLRGFNVFGGDRVPSIKKVIEFPQSRKVIYVDIAILANSRHMFSSQNVVGFRLHNSSINLKEYTNRTQKWLDKILISPQKKMRDEVAEFKNVLHKRKGGRKHHQELIPKSMGRLKMKGALVASRNVTWPVDEEEQTNNLLGEKFTELVNNSTDFHYRKACGI